MNKKPESDRLLMLQSAVPKHLLVFISALASDEGRTISQMARRLLEESPRVKVAMKNGKRGKAKK